MPHGFSCQRRFGRGIFDFGVVSLHSKVVLWEGRFPKTFSVPEKTPCYVHVDIPHTMKLRVLCLRRPVLPTVSCNPVFHRACGLKSPCCLHKFTKNPAQILTDKKKTGDFSAWYIRIIVSENSVKKKMIGEMLKIKPCFMDILGHSRT